MIQINKYSTAEEVGRNKFRAFLKSNNIENKIEKYVESDDDYSIWDVKMQINKTIYLVEIKNRAKMYSNYNDMLLEEDKFNSLQKHKSDLMNKIFDIDADLKVKIMYFNSYNDSNKIKMALLDELKPTFIKEYQNRTSVENKGKKLKSLTYLKEYKEYKI